MGPLSRLCAQSDSATPQTSMPVIVQRSVLSACAILPTTEACLEVSAADHMEGVGHWALHRHLFFFKSQSKSVWSLCSGQR